MKSALVTGASSGIGWATALALDRDGWHVFAGARSAEAQAHLRDVLSPYSQAVRLDVTRPDEIAAAVALAGEQSGGRLDALINNAGIVVTGPFEALTAEALREQFAVNVFGLADVTRACLPLLRAAGGRIVNVGSVSGRTTWPFNSPYAASKYAVRALNDSLRVELRPFGVRVILVEPGAIATPLWDKTLPPGFLRTDALDPATRARYEAVLLAVGRSRAAIKFRAARPETVSRAIWRALNAPEPRAHYVVGADAFVQLAWEAAVPRTVREALLAFAIERIAPARRGDPP
ncbi:MAG: SDR family oxidoreductase [Candidatus Baltobacteraceae bacterium]|jgi:NAD(P)-dependent dehydrogenase (short-subunit alcohol dehydrogenase family)